MPLVSPDELLKAAKDAMLEGREPETREDWARIVNFFAYNIESSLELAAVELLVKIYAMPLTATEVEDIVRYQISIKQTEKKRKEQAKK